MKIRQTSAPYFKSPQPVQVAIEAEASRWRLPASYRVQNAFNLVFCHFNHMEWVRRITPALDNSKQERHFLAMVFGSVEDGFSALNVSPSNKDEIYFHGFGISNQDTPEGLEEMRELNIAFIVAVSKQMASLPPIH